MAPGFVQLALDALFGRVRKAACSAANVNPDPRLVPDVGHGQILGQQGVGAGGFAEMTALAKSGVDFLAGCEPAPIRSSASVRADDVSGMIRDAEIDPGPTVSGVLGDSWGGPVVAFSQDEIRENGILQ